MRPGPHALPGLTSAVGSVYLAAVVTLLVSRTPLGSPLFFALAAVATLAYGIQLARVWTAGHASPTALHLALGLAVLFRLPLAFAPVGADSDMVRYLWDGRVQQRGYNPYSVLPSDPALAATHSPESVRMPSLRAHTPYPPAAQLFFRLVVSLYDSTRAMKLALVTCDLLTMLCLWRWLASTGRNQWLTIAYAWNPLVVLEVAHSGHIDALGALWLTASAYWLTQRRTALATLAFVLAVTTKLLPIVLLPLFIGRVRVRDAIAGAALLAALYLWFLDSTSPPLGAVPNVIAYIRFNGPVFLALAALISARGAALAALGAGLATALFARRRLAVSDPAGWAAPMGVALLGAPVVYPWYLLYLTPFLWTRSTLPLLAWCISGLGAYIVWDRSRHGGRWVVPPGVEAVEFLIPVAIAAILALRARRRYSRGPHAS